MKWNALCVTGAVLLGLATLSALTVLPFVGGAAYYIVSGVGVVGAILWGIGAVLGHWDAPLDGDIPDPWFGYDKLAHVLGTIAIMVLVGTLATDWAHVPLVWALTVASVLALLAGVLKEATDTRWSWKDITADLLGIVLVWVGRYLPLWIAGR